jgi:hypothetical protein
MTEKQGSLTATRRAFMRRLAGLAEEKPAKRTRWPDPLVGATGMIVLDGLNVGSDIRAAVETPVSMPCCERVSRLIELLQQANSLLKSSGGKSHKKCERLIGELNSLSQRYKWSPAYRVSDKGLSLFWHFPNTDNWEDLAVWWIRQLVENHTIHRLRRCSQCKRTWFCAATEHQRFCGDKCRKKHASASPIFKEKRRRYMAEVYRPRERHADAAALDKTRKRRG